MRSRRAGTGTKEPGPENQGQKIRARKPGLDQDQDQDQETPVFNTQRVNIQEKEVFVGFKNLCEIKGYTPERLLCRDAGPRSSCRTEESMPDQRVRAFLTAYAEVQE